jgi:uncharacterized protein with HEPN domain
MTKSDSLFLSHMLRAIDRLVEIAAKTDFGDFESDWVIQNAVMRELEIVGEAAGRLSTTLTEANPDIPWRQVTALRHKLIHDYFEVDIDIVWQTADREYPGNRAEASYAG